MKIYSISKVLALPFVILGILILYYSSSVDRAASIFVFIPALFLVAIYVFNGPIDHWWLTKYPIQFDPKLRNWLLKHFPFYINLDETQRKKFEYRLGLYLEGRLFKSIGAEQRDVPEDIKCMVAAHGIAINLGLDDYLVGNMDRVFLYKHPFPTPDIPHLHNVETNVEDGVIILSLEQLTNSILYPSDYFNIAYFAYAEISTKLMLKEPFPDCENTWNEIKEISGFSKETILNQTGLKDLLPLTIHIVLFISFSDKYKSHFPENYERFSHIFNQRPQFKFLYRNL